jgi:hypothetical protein
MHQLPARIFLDSVFDCRGRPVQIVKVDHVQTVVSSNILLKSPNEDHADHTDKEDNKDGRIDKGEPVDFRILNLEILVPTSCPWGRRLSPADAVGPCDRCLRVFIQVNRTVFITCGGPILGDPGAAPGTRLDENTDYSILLLVTEVHRMVVNNDIEMIVQN